MKFIYNSKLVKYGPYFWTPSDRINDEFNKEFPLFTNIPMKDLTEKYGAMDDWGSIFPDDLIDINDETHDKTIDSKSMPEDSISVDNMFIIGIRITPKDIVYYRSYRTTNNEMGILKEKDLGLVHVRVILQDGSVFESMISLSGLVLSLISEFDRQGILNKFSEDDPVRFDIAILSSVDLPETEESTNFSYTIRIPNKYIESFYSSDYVASMN